MSRQVKAWAVKARAELIARLGGKCVKCRERDPSLLQFDHKVGKTYSTRGLSTDQRMCRYRKEAALGHIQLLCLFCNSRRGQRMSLGDTDAELTQAERDAIDLPEYEFLIREQNPDDPF